MSWAYPRQAPATQEVLVFPFDDYGDPVTDCGPYLVTLTGSAYQRRGALNAILERLVGDAGHRPRPDQYTLRIGDPVIGAVWTYQP